MADNSEPMLDRDFLFNVVNTCDRTYFPGQLKRIDNERLEAAQKVDEDVIEVNSEMYELLQAFGRESHFGGKPNARSLAQLKKSSKKRSRAQFDAQTKADGREPLENPAFASSKRLKF